MNHVINHFVKPVGKKELNIKIKTTTDIKQINLIYGDPYDYTKISSDNYQWNKQSYPMNLRNKTNHNHYFEAIFKPNNARCKYYFQLITQDDSIHFYGQKGIYNNDTNLDLYSTFYIPYIHSHEIYQELDWVSSQIWCQIFVDRFSNGDTSNDPLNTQNWDDPKITPYSFYGGDLRGIINQLDHLKELGFTGLYLTPIFTSPSNHKYDTINYHEIDPHFGSKEDLKELVEACHNRDMKIILDAVFNHSGHLFPPFVDVTLNKKQSSYYDWFHILQDDPLEYETFANTYKMPKLKTSHPQLESYLLDILLTYLRDFKIDGWRFDVANELDQQFIRNINKTIKSEFPNAYLLAEVWHDPKDYIDYDKFDANMEYEIGTVFIEWLNKKINTDTLITRLSEIDHRTPMNHFSNQFHLLDSHDTARIINQVYKKKNKALMALIFLMLQKGSICLFYGTDYLLEGENDPYCRIPYPINPTLEQIENQNKFRNILNFRKEYLNSIQKEPVQYLYDNESLIVNYQSLSISFDLNKELVLVNGEPFNF